ncbi:phosphotransferase family protein [Bradyrhizobium jicamae]|uniref:Phosphotransferase family protein n=1 Tax=Bradyrhizobium jicamae TaxID=280332 RepID=A0ABS5FSC3_9BRAD|nr:phosphotransferase family protein [Bradyrhizobium jicamae]MBR0799646.1 phosphotransferase family protein [Bradyrhizobium jicamae]
MRRQPYNEIWETIGLDSRETKLRAGLSRFLDSHWRPGAEASELVHVPGGASRETWRFKARADGEDRGMILRIDPETSLIDTDRRTEYRAMEAAFKSGLPVPEALYLVEDLRWLDRPFSISAEVPGCQTSAEAFPPQHLGKIGQQKWTLLGQIAALDPIALGLGDVMPATSVGTCAMEQLDYWANVIDEDSLHPYPVAQAAIRWLRRHPPPPAQKLALVHGDFRSGNFLYLPDGEIRAILDWEMAHMGDPLEDLAWSLDPLWSWVTPGLAGRLLPHKEAVRHWEAGSGITLDIEAFRWWQVFAALKGLGIWISSSEDFHFGGSQTPILALAGWLMTDRHQQILVDYLSPSSPHRYLRDVK